MRDTSERKYCGYFIALWKKRYKRYRRVHHNLPVYRYRKVREGRNVIFYSESKAATFYDKMMHSPSSSYLFRRMERLVSAWIFLPYKEFLLHQWYITRVGPIATSRQNVAIFQRKLFPNLVIFVLYFDVN